MYFAAFSFVFSLILVAGGFLCLYLGIRLVRSRTRSAQAKSSFSGRWGDVEFNIGAGSLAALAMTLSILWVAAGIATKPDFEYLVDSSGERFRVSAVVDKLEEVDRKISSMQTEQDEFRNVVAAAELFNEHKITDADFMRIREAQARMMASETASETRQSAARELLELRERSRAEAERDSERRSERPAARPNR